jgi:hypothetical protein
MPDKKPEPREPLPAYQPTPTQAENDLAAVGQTVIEKEPDGSGPVVEPQTGVTNARSK